MIWINGCNLLGLVSLADKSSEQQAACQRRYKGLACPRAVVLHRIWNNGDQRLKFISLVDKSSEQPPTPQVNTASVLRDLVTSVASPVVKDRPMVLDPLF